MVDTNVMIMFIVFSLTILFMLWRPYGINETIPTTIGAGIILLTGIVSWSDVFNIFDIVRGPTLTILATIMMTIVLDSIGLFRWIAVNIVIRSKGSGVRLYLYTNLLCFLMTLLFNNDGSILITTPIIIYIAKLLHLKPHQSLPYLISGAIIATAASAPIAVSNISNLIALKIVNLSLNSYVQMMFIPSMIGIFTIAILMYFYFRKNLPKKIKNVHFKFNHPLQIQYSHPLEIKNEFAKIDWTLFKHCVTIVVLTRACFFLFSPLGVATEWVGLTGAIMLIGYRWIKNRTGIIDVIKGTPWHILLFAFNMYVLVYGLKNIGLTEMIHEMLQGVVESSIFSSIFVMGFLSTAFSNLFNNLPAVMISTLSITEMDLQPLLLQAAYLANVIGSDIGALLTPIGTLATLIWMFILKENAIKITWGQYLKVTILVIPIGLMISLLSLYLWIVLLY